VVVIGVIVILLGITVFAVAAMAKDSKLSSAINTVQSALGKARALAMKRGEPVLVAFYPHVDEDYEHLHIVFAAYSGASYVNGNQLVDRFVPVTGQEQEELPRGIKVGGPQYEDLDGGGAGTPNDFAWLAASTIRANVTEAAGYVIAVMFDRDGSMITENARTDSTRIFLDVNNNALQWEGGTDHDNRASWPNENFFQQVEEEDEPYLVFAPFLSVYDDDQAREFAPDLTQWNNSATKTLDLTNYINEFADRLHFNRYTGVVMR
jgi:hypothetical protein